MSVYLEKLRLLDIDKSKSLSKLLKRAFGAADFGSKFLHKCQTKLDLDFRSLISINFCACECILAPLCENRYFQAMFTVRGPSGSEEIQV